MGGEFWSMFQLETKRLLWFIGITFAVIIAFQYLELPYGNVLSSSGSAISQATNTILNNVTIFNQANSTVPRNGFILEPASPVNESLGFKESDKNSMLDSNMRPDSVSNTQKVDDLPPSSHNITKDLSFSTNGSSEENTAPSPNAPTYLSPPLSPTSNVSPNITTAVLSNDDNKSLSQKDDITSFKPSQNGGSIPGENSAVSTVSKDNGDTHTPISDVSTVSKENRDTHTPVSDVTTVAEMNKLLLQSHASYRSMKPRWFSAVDQELLQARSEIENAPIVENDPDLYGPLYLNVSMFKRSYELMEKTLKVYVYREGARPILHSPFLTGIYASEGWFMKLMEANTRFVTKDPKKAHLFYLPFSSRMLEEVLYVKNSHSRDNMVQYLHDYVDLISGRYPFWNRTGGADHFLVGCHDWAPAETKVLMATCIRSLCNADVKEGFVFGKDTSLPETFVRNALNPTRDLGGNRGSKKTTLAFFAGSMHGYLRPILLQHWENKDPDLKIFGKLPRSKGNSNYIHYMKSSKYCICAKGYEVNSPRVVEAIFYECVPVIISDNFVPPFLEVLNWESFAVIVLEKDIPNLKNILLSIPKKKYLRLLMRVKKVQKHFLWHRNPVKYDIFHMILHSIWYNRVFSAPS